MAYRRVLVAVLAMCMAGVLVAQEEPAPTPTPAPDPVVAAVGTAGARLLRYATPDARAALAPVQAARETDARVAVALGRVLEQEKKYDESAAVLRKAVALAPADPEAHVWLGETLLRQKKQAEADAAFQKAIDLTSPKVATDTEGKDLSSRYWLGVAQQRRRVFDRSAETLSKLLELQPGHLMATYQLGLTRAFQGRWADAVTLLTKALESDSGIAYAYYYRALAQEKLGRKDQLVLDMERFLALAPNAPEAERARAVVAAAKR
ncbi:MAG TPA: tetratricopeptide repeat protein [Thermoanaerobaculaceae bacterium]|nr:tetratricopeptide repeat protein [Thermoanaerobaculaceae bacterium]HRS17472.1 tetratricopeptide repeat protein [Thermoanaerobaculaceae bacterium]